MAMFPRMLFTLVLCLITVSAQSASRSRVDPLIRNLMREGDVPGLSIVVIDRARIAWEQAYGFANADQREPLTKQHVFESASLGKPVFAYAVLRLADAGVLSLDVPLQQYLPEPVTDQRMKLITARMVLTHSTGFQNEVMPGQTLAVHFEPGSRFSYSGAGYLYLERVVEQLTKKELTALMQELVFIPLGMRDSGYVWIPEYETRKVFGHTAGGRVAERRKPANGTMATLHTTPRDFARFMIAMMKGTGLKAATARAMRTTQMAVDAGCYNCLTRNTGTMSPTLSWGLGWAIEQTARGTAFWHWGENNGEIQNFAMAYPEGRGVVIFTNSGNGFSIMPDVVAAALGNEHPAFAWMGYEHYDAPAKVLLRDLRARGAELALAAPTVNTLSESQINAIGYALLERGKIPDAVRVFERNMQRFPASANAFDSLGEAYAAEGDREKAIANYQRSLDLNPKNTNAAEWLEKLRAAR